MEDKSKNLISTIMTVMIVVILAVVSALIIGTFLGNSVFDDVPVTGTNTNETLTNVTNITASSFAILSTYPTATCTLSNVHNATGGELLGAGNYTYSSCSIILTNLSSYIGEDLNATYDFSRPSGTNTAGLNVTALSNNFGLFVTGLVAFLAIIGTISGVIWLIVYVKQLFDKKTGLQAISA